MRNSIRLDLKQMQHVQEVHTLRRISFLNFLKSIAHENGTYTDDGLNVDLSALDIFTKRLILSYIVDADVYEWSCKSSTRTEALFKENLNYIRERMDEACDHAYLEIMEEAGLHACHYEDNNEIYFTK